MLVHSRENASPSHVPRSNSLSKFPTFYRFSQESFHICVYLPYVVTICSQADVALTILRERKDSFDLVLSDVHMPGMNGYNLLQQVGLLEMDLPVISKTLLLCFVSKD